MALQPPPPASDLDAVYMPHEDPNVQAQVKSLDGSPEASPTACPAVVQPSLSAELFDSQPCVVASTQACAPVSADLLGDFVGSTPAQPAPGGLDIFEDHFGQSSGHEQDFLPGQARSHSQKSRGVLSGVDLDTPKVVGVINLSSEGPLPQSSNADNPKRETPASSVANPIPTDAKGFGSDDLFGQKSGHDKTPYTAVIDMLPETVKQHIPAVPSCMASRVEEEVAEETLAMIESPGDLEQIHMAKAVDRACDGKWVPAYMRQQMVEHGHTSLPTRPNAHEYDAGIDPPPTLGSTVQGMGEDLGETAQSMLTFVIAVISSLAFQCQMCTNQAATTAHERVTTLGETMCENMFVDEDSLPILGPLPGEATAGYGPLRSRVRRSLKDVSFEKLMKICKGQLTTTNGPGEFKRTVDARDTVRQRLSPDHTAEDLLYSTQIKPEALPEEALRHVCCSGRPIVWRERWHVDIREKKASIEISNEPSAGPILCVLRIDIESAPGDGGCEVDSRLFARPHEHGAVLPLGLVEQLSDAHHHYCESLRDGVLGFAGDEPEAAARANSRARTVGTSVAEGSAPCGNSVDNANQPLPLVAWPVPEKRPPSRAADGPRCQGGLTGAAHGGKLDKSFLLQVADGI